MAGKSNGVQVLPATDKLGAGFAARQLGLRKIERSLNETTDSAVKIGRDQTKRPAGFMAYKQIEKMIQGLNILIVDDNAYMRRLTRTMLTNLGGKSVLEANDGLAALEAIRNSDQDVMLLDWNMPVLNGIEVSRIMRSAAQSADHHDDDARETFACA